ncbi:MAG TPA: MBL fold metallo-hydrolase, partial [Candidatus Udaeobacter sp.]|nr:MBL fold metallo-hydrolase [Candidatus Udaeobacter sp.]
VLFDGGSGTLRRLAEAGIDYRTIDQLFYTHLHPDHTGDLVPFLFAQRYRPAPPRTTALSLHGPRGFQSFVTQLKVIYGRWIEGPDYAVEVRELWDSATAVGSLRIAAVPMRHSVAAVGYRITDGDGLTCAYTGDTDVTPRVVELARGAELLIADCAMPDESKIDGHLTPGLVGELATEAGVGMVCLSHFYPPCDRVDVVAQCRRTFAGPVIAAADLMQIELAAGSPPRVSAPESPR